MENEKKDFKIRWISFGRVISDPWAVVLYLLIGVLIVFYTSAKEDYVKSLLTLLFSIVASVLGGIYAKRWSDLNEEKILFARGTTAIRSLKLLLQQIASVEDRAKLFFKRNEKEAENELTRLNYEEIIDRCRLLEEQTIGAIENWNDIIPEADVKTQIGIVSELKQKIEESEKQIDSVTQQKESSDKEKNSKETETKALKKELEKLRIELREKEQRLNQSGLSGIAFGSQQRSISKYNADGTGYILNSTQNNCRCNKCNTEFYNLGVYSGVNCPACGSTEVSHFFRVSE